MRPRARRGVQTIIAVIILTIVVIVASLLVYQFLVSNIEEAESPDPERLEAEAQVNIISVIYDDTANELNVTVLNTHDSLSVTLVAGYIVNETFVHPFDFPDVTLGPAESDTITVSVTLDPGRYKVALITSEGVEISERFTVRP